MTDGLFALLLIFFYCIPFLVVGLTPIIDGEIRKIGLSIKGVDLLTPYLLFTIHIFSMIAFQLSLFPYMIILVSLVGIGLASFLAFKKKSLHLKKFLRVWWRYVFLLAALTHIIVGGLTMYGHFFT